MLKESGRTRERVATDGEGACLLGRARDRHGVQSAEHIDRSVVSEDYVLCRPAKDHTPSALLKHEACSSWRRHEAAEEVRALLAGLNFIIYGMMLACIAQCHCAITNNNGASVHCPNYRQQYSCMTGRHILGAMAYTWLHVLGRGSSGVATQADLDGR